MQNFTPGPWEVDDDYVREVKPYDDEGHRMAVARITINKNRRPTNEWRANARLIAAAPDLLEACKHALEAHRKGSEPADWAVSRLEAAIAKATGK